MEWKQVKDSQPWKEVVSPFLQEELEDCIYVLAFADLTPDRVNYERGRLAAFITLQRMPDHEAIQEELKHA